MKQILVTMVNSFFAPLVGTLVLSIFLTSSAIFHNFGIEILTAKTLNHGWLVVFVWLVIILVLALIKNEKQAEKEDN